MQEYVHTLLCDVDFRERMDYAAWEGRYQVLLTHLETIHQRWPKEDDLAHYEAKYYKFDDIVAKLTDALARHEQTRLGSVVETPCRSKEARSGIHPNVSIPSQKGATETYAACKGNVYDWTPVKGEPVPADMSPV